MTIDPKFKLSEDASEEQRLIHKTIISIMGEDAEYSGGCKGFYTEEEWAARGESYGDKAPIVVVHDGGGAAPFFNYDYEDYKKVERMTKALGKIGYYASPCTNWYTAIYPVEVA